ncbi:MAG: 2-oxo acid dehydrogenase subunit E2 [Alphaproteobacteria bacterium]|nr:2-oxo acid dehydrogenase subunit E2 [Alphaproteobacteria bacterium]
MSATATTATTDFSKDRMPVSPLARRVAEKAGIDINLVPGTGPNGRIVLTDVEKYIASLKPNETKSVQVEQTEEPKAPPVQAKEEPAHEVIDLPLRVDVADRQSVPDFRLSIDCEIDELLKLCKSMQDTYGAEVSINDCVVRAAALAMRKVPRINLAYDGDGAVRNSQSDIAVEFASKGAIKSFVLKQVEGKTLPQIAAETKAKLDKTENSDAENCGFAILSMNARGSRSLSAPVTPPYICVLATGAGEQRPVAKHGRLVAATVMTFSLSIDSRVINAFAGNEFMATLKSLIEQPYNLVV